MAVPAIYLAIVVIYTILVLGFLSRNTTILILAGFGMMGISVYTAINGLDGFKNFLIVIFSIVNFAVGAYISAMISMELLKNF